MQSPGICAGGTTIACLDSQFHRSLQVRFLRKGGIEGHMDEIAALWFEPERLICPLTEEPTEGLSP
jgi:hypothetical protein